MVFMTVAAMAQTPTTVTYQGRLTNATGTAITSAVTVVFTIYDAETSGSELWTETQSVDPDDKGIFTVTLGNDTPLDNTVFDGSARWLGIKVGSDAEMTPRQQINSAPYSITGAGATNFSFGSSTQDGTFDLYGAAVVDPLIHAGRGASGGMIQIRDTLGNYAGVLGGSVTGAGVLGLYRSAGNVGLLTGSIGGEPLFVVQGSGDDVTFNMGTTGNNSVSLPASSIAAGEILDEPGIARAYASGGTIATSGVTSLLSRTITVPGPGYVVAIAHAYAAISGTTLGNVIMGIDTTNSNSAPAGNNYAVFGSSSETISASTIRWGSMSVERTFSVSAAGGFTCYVNGSRGTTSGTGYLYYVNLLLVYFPTSYGTVSAITAAKDAGQYENATPLASGETAAMAIPAPTDLYEVDLRELELKAAKAQAEAERAQKELLQAKLKQQMENITNNQAATKEN
jgi:hypothetical protein